MIRIIFALILQLVLFNIALAGCEIPDEGDSDKPGFSSYYFKHDIYEPVDKSVSTNDEIIISNNINTELCFLVTQVFDNVHMCFLSGKAKKVSKNRYIYTENKCSVSMTFTKDTIKFTAHGSLQDGCTIEDLAGNNGCGFNTSIYSAIFKKARKKGSNSP